MDDRPAEYINNGFGYLVSDIYNTRCNPPGVLRDPNCHRDLVCGSDDAGGVDYIDYRTGVNEHKFAVSYVHISRISLLTTKW